MALALFSAVHYDNFMYNVIILGDMPVNSKHYTNFVYSCRWNLGDVREFKTLYRFRVFLSLESGKRP